MNLRMKWLVYFCISFVAFLLAKVISDHVNSLPFVGPILNVTWTFYDMVTIQSLLCPATALSLVLVDIFAKLNYLYYRFILKCGMLAITLMITANISMFFINVPFKPQVYLLYALISVAALFVMENKNANKPSKIKYAEYKWYLLNIPVVVYLFLATASLYSAYKYKTDTKFRNVIYQLKINLGNSSQYIWTQRNYFPNTFFTEPMVIIEHPTIEGKFYVMEQLGKIISISKESGKKQVELDFTDKVHVGKGDIYHENGSLGFDLHPDFGKSGSNKRGMVYIYYTARQSEGREMGFRLSGFDISLDTLIGRNESEIKFFEIPIIKNSGGHIGGGVVFGNDGFLHVGLGDGGNNPDPQSIFGSFFGSVIRIDIDSDATRSHPIKMQPKFGSTTNYFIPNDNPFVGIEGSLEEIFALGFRQPFKMSVDKKNGDIWVGEVGHDTYEELNLLKNGGNYQWKYMEGPEIYRNQSVEPKEILGQETPPFYFYKTDAYDRCIIIGNMYREDRYKSLKEKFIFADNNSGRVKSLDLVSKNVSVLTRVEATSIFGISSVSIPRSGEILVTVLGDRKKRNGMIIEIKSKNPAVENEATAVKFGKKSPEELYSIYCSRCHGIAGDLDGVEDQVNARAFTDRSWQESRTDGQLSQVIKKGGHANGLSSSMPAFDAILSKNDINGLVEKIRSFAH
jgi:mono/diheme cytochrome c family protein